VKAGWSLELGPGRAFIADGIIHQEENFFGHMKTEEDFKGWFFQRFTESYQAKKPEQERLKLCEKYYSGFHYDTPAANRSNKVTNICFATVETVHPVMTETKPRPEIVPRQQFGDGQAEQLQEFAQWYMDTAEWTMNHHIGTRVKLKYGWNTHLVVYDPKTGLGVPRQYSDFDFYKDPFSTHEDEMEWFFLAKPVPTARLIDQFPDKAAEIFSDNIASPSYDVLERPYFDAYGSSGDYAGLDGIVASAARFEGDPDSPGRALVSMDSGSMGNAGTTFLIQGFFRDRTKRRVLYGGSIAEQQADGTWMHTPSAKPYQRFEPVSDSGWRVVQMTAGGCLLSSKPLDPAFLGIPIVIGRDYHHEGRFYSVGEQDHIIPINRSMNRRYNLLNRSLEYEAVPVLLADNDTGINLDQRSVEPGDLLKKARGSDISWLTFQGAGAHQFELLDLEKRDADTISGVHDVQQGRRPEGIEAASAIRNLQDAAQTRIRGKEGPAGIEYARLLKKCLVLTARKAKGMIPYRAANGMMTAIDPQTLLMQYDIRFAEGTGTVISRQMSEEKNLNLFDRGLLDQQTTLEKLGVTNIPVIMARTAMAAQAEAAAAAANAPPEEEAA